jgi:aspartate dehydrogenase
MKRIVLIGYGAIAHMVCDKLEQHSDQVTIVGVLVRKGREAEVRAGLGAGTQVIADMGDIARIAPNLVVECAGQGAVEQYAEDVLRAGIDLMVISTGALADDGTRARLIAAAERSGARLVLPSGAVAGIDGLMAHRIGGLKSVRYTSTKPPYAWKGTPAEDEFDLDGITERCVIFTGPAHEAARRYPKNANLAATVALAGLGMEKTEIQLVADPAVAPNNVGRIDAEGTYGTLTVECRGLPAPSNPKTSATTALSVVHAILKGTGAIVM